jgi:hypothetical protein
MWHRIQSNIGGQTSGGSICESLHHQGYEARRKSWRVRGFVGNAEGSTRSKRFGGIRSVWLGKQFAERSVGCSTADDDRRAAWHAQADRQEQGEDGSGPHRDSLEKVENQQIQSHQAILQLAESRCEITLVMFFPGR